MLMMIANCLLRMPKPPLRRPKANISSLKEGFSPAPQIVNLAAAISWFTKQPPSWLNTGL
jgi:hypothetical protein